MLYLFYPSLQLSLCLLIQVFSFLFLSFKVVPITALYLSLRAFSTSLDSSLHFSMLPSFAYLSANLIKPLIASKYGYPVGLKSYSGSVIFFLLSSFYSHFQKIRYCTSFLRLLNYRGFILRWLFSQYSSSPPLVSCGDTFYNTLLYQFSYLFTISFNQFIRLVQLLVMLFLLQQLKSKYSSSFIAIIAQWYSSSVLAILAQSSQV